MEKPSRTFIVWLLGALSIISPFAIDMHLPAFALVGADLGVGTQVVSLTLSAYFIGMALGQIFYGPLLDRYGRKRPLLSGLALFVAASVGCAYATTIEALVALRFIQALGGCVAGVASLSMVRDLFEVRDVAKIMSRLFLFIAASPLFAPAIGGMIAFNFGWHAVFFALAGGGALIITLIYFQLPETHQPDPSISLKPLPIIREYLSIIRHPRFITYALSGAFSFAGLFTYVAGSPIVFMDGFRVSAETYSMIFAGTAMGFIAASQLNVLLLKRLSSEQLYAAVLALQVLIGAVFMFGSYHGWYDLQATLVLFFFFLSSVGISYPNAAALAIAPFKKNVGSASALLGFLQLGVGSLISTAISVFPSKGSFPVIAIMGITSIIGLIILMAGYRRAHADTSCDL